MCARAHTHICNIKILLKTIYLIREQKKAYTPLERPHAFNMRKKITKLHTESRPHQQSHDWNEANVLTQLGEPEIIFEINVITLFTHSNMLQSY